MERLSSSLRSVARQVEPAVVQILNSSYAIEADSGQSSGAVVSQERSSGNGGVQVNTANTTVRGLAACGSTPSSCPSLDFGLGVIDPTQRVGRGLLRAPGLWDVDLAGDKRFKLNERLALQFRAELFNALNNVNFLRPNRSLNSPATFGLITTQRLLGNTESRQVQLAARIEF